MARSTPASPQTRSLDAHEPLWLDDPERAWLLTAGRVQVFAVDVVGGRVSGPRRPLFAAARGDALLSAPSGSGLALLAVGVESGTEAHSISSASLWGAHGADRDRAVELIDRWLETLAGCVAMLSPVDPILLEVGLPFSVPRDAIVEARLQTLWIPGGGALGPLGTSPADADIVLPLPRGLWARVSAPFESTPLATGDALSQPTARAGAEALLRAVLEQIAAVFAERDNSVAAQLDERVQLEEQLRADTYTGLAAILGGSRADGAAAADADRLLDAMRLVAAQIDVEVVKPSPRAAAAASDPVELIARTSRFRTRRVVLDHEWWKADAGPLLGSLADGGGPVALLQRRGGGYEIVDDNTRTRVDASTAPTVARDATMIYRPLPVTPVSGREVVRFVIQPVRRDLVRLVVYGLAAALVSVVTPLVTKQVFSQVVPGLQRTNLAWYALLVAVFSIAAFGFVVAQQLAVTRVEGRGFGALQAALWDRVLDLPLPFFRDYTAGGLAVRVMGVDQIRALVTTAVGAAALAVPIGAANLALAFVLQWRLALFGSFVIALILAALVLLVRYQVTRQRRVRHRMQELFGTAVGLVDSVGKLRVADAERRGFVQWARRFGALKEAFYEAQLGYVALTSFVASAPALATVVLVAAAATLSAGTISGATFIAFNAAFLVALGAAIGLTVVATFVGQAVPIYDNLRPVLTAVRESDLVRTDPGVLGGQVALSHVSFRYSSDSPLVLDDVTFEVEPGEFVALVGASGSGKSTLLRVLLGFVRPEVGSIRFDGKDIETLDPRAVRRQMGVVLQSAGLLPGTIFTNIALARTVSMEEAWAAVRIAGLEAEVKALPMGMHTFISEGAAAFSGGQRQRILIARAVVGKPRLLIFDEATSALDNRTQAEVSAAIGHLRATRIVVAHRLSTVRHADRILVFDAGHIVQHGSFDELMATAGPFRELAGRQLL